MRYKGVICAIRDAVGYVERADVVREISFKLADAVELGDIQLGDELEFNIETRNVCIYVFFFLHFISYLFSSFFFCFLLSFPFSGLFLSVESSVL